jgi:hypothetical protein
MGAPFGQVDVCRGPGLLTKGLMGEIFKLTINYQLSKGKNKENLEWRICLSPKGPFPFPELNLTP